MSFLDEEKNLYCSKERVYRFFWYVLGVHLVLVACPWFGELFRSGEPEEPPLFVVDPGNGNPKGDSLDIPKEEDSIGAELAEEPPPSEPEPVPEEPPAPEPPPPPEPDPVAPPAPKPPEKKPEPPKKPEQKKKPKILTADQIKMTNKRVKVKPTTPKVKPATPRLTAAQIERQRERRRMLESLNGTGSAAGRGLRYGDPDGGLKGLVAKREVRNYLEKLDAYIQPLWKQPNVYELDQKLPSATFIVSIDKSGRVLSVKMERPSGVRAMDESVQEVIRKLTNAVVPPPPYALSVPVTLRVRAD